MFASVAAILVNLVFNYFLIFGKCGFPELGVTGAAIATVLSRYVETAIIMVYTHMTISSHFALYTRCIQKPARAEAADDQHVYAGERRCWSMNFCGRPAWRCCCNAILCADWMWWRPATLPRR